ncbi:hypothetical protein OESDEN_04929 [Oesophagostomum dentatum]|uniref:G-protein coupled receptors family 1 profile domain-containing protein n=1 Tax=Oesophagostomum dentatum TaxID=61180 RepID=A0A0B1TGE8_OESDE|nr:hypothetical protein OESDEN_04929 [Oesophagostomum dentatum]
MLIASRMVQLCIPYILIANTAFRLASINGRTRQTGDRSLQVIVLIIAAIVVALRLPGYFFIEVVKLPNCDLFESLILSGKEMEPQIARMYRISDVFIQVCTGVQFTSSVSKAFFLQFLHLFVSFVILCVLNCVVLQKLRSSHRRARRQSSCPSVMHTVCFNSNGGL